MELKFYKELRNNWQMNVLDPHIHLRDTCIKELRDHINIEIYEECSEFIKKVRECRHKTILTRNLSKFN